MTVTDLPGSSPRGSDRISIRRDDDAPATVSAPSVNPGPAAIFVLLASTLIGLTVAFGFQALSPDTPFVILGGTMLAAATLGLIGLYRYQLFLLGTLAIRPALDDLIADEFGTFQPSAILGILAILVTALHLISRRVTGNWNPMTPMGWAFTGFFVFFVPSFITSVDRGVSQAAMFGLASVVLLYVAIEQQLLDDERNLVKLLLASGIGMLVPIVTGFVQFFFTGTLDPGGSGLVRIDGSFAHPNTFATYLSFGLLIAFAVIPTLDVKPKLGLLIASGLGSFLLIATFARGAWASFLIGSLLLAARINKNLVFLIIGASFAAAAVIPGVGDRLSNLTASTGPNGGAKTDDSLGWRFGYWERIWPFTSQNPVSGIGIDATKTQTVEAKDPHNSILQAYLEGGILGAFGFFALLAIATYAAVYVWRRARKGEFDRQTTVLSAGAIAALLSVAAQLITENVLLNTIVWWYLNIAFAHLAVLTWGRRRKKATAEPTPDYQQLALPEGGTPQAGSRTHSNS